MVGPSTHPATSQDAILRLPGLHSACCLPLLLIRWVVPVNPLPCSKGVTLRFPLFRTSQGTQGSLSLPLLQTLYFVPGTHLASALEAILLPPSWLPRLHRCVHCLPLVLPSLTPSCPCATICPELRHVRRLPTEHGTYPNPKDTHLLSTHDASQLVAKRVTTLSHAIDAHAEGAAAAKGLQVWVGCRSALMRAPAAASMPTPFGGLTAIELPRQNECGAVHTHFIGIDGSTAEHVSNSLLCVSE